MPIGHNVNSSPAYFFIACYSIDDQGFAFIASIGQIYCKHYSCYLLKVFIAHIAQRQRDVALIRLLIGSDMVLNCSELPSLARTTQTKLARQCSGNIFLLQCKMSGHAGT